MKKIIVFVLIICFLFFGCSKDRLTDPTELGNEIGLKYIEMYEELNFLVSNRPDVDTLKPLLLDLKNKYIENFINLGKYNEEMSDADKSAASAIAWGEMLKIDSAVRDSVEKARMEYWNKDMELGNLIGEFNIITQYAFYDLLREQLPEEAERLGIE